MSSHIRLEIARRLPYKLDFSIGPLIPFLNYTYLWSIIGKWSIICLQITRKIFIQYVHLWVSPLFSIKPSNASYSSSFIKYRKMILYSTRDNEWVFFMSNNKRKKCLVTNSYSIYRRNCILTSEPVLVEYQNKMPWSTDSAPSVLYTITSKMARISIQTRKQLSTNSKALTPLLFHFSI